MKAGGGGWCGIRSTKESQQSSRKYNTVTYLRGARAVEVRIEGSGVVQVVMRLPARENMRGRVQSMRPATFFRS